jgi:hypothetical protein
VWRKETSNINTYHNLKKKLDARYPDTSGGHDFFLYFLDNHQFKPKNALQARHRVFVHEAYLDMVLAYNKPCRASMGE